MTINDLEQFIKNDQLVAISYLTVKEPEVVHPRIKRLDGQLYVYGRTSQDKKLRDIAIGEFLRLMAMNASGLAIGGNRGGGAGRQTSISFSKLDRITIDPSFRQLVVNFS